MPCTAELIQTIGKSALIDLQAAFGPRQLHIPARPDPEHPIAAAIGLEAMTRLCDEYGCTSTYIGVNYLKQRRNRQITQMVVAGHPLETIARRFGISGKYVRILTHQETAPVMGVRARQRRAWAQGLQEPQDEPRGIRHGNAPQATGTPCSVP